MNLLAKTAMVMSFAYYALTFGYLWVGQILGLHNEVWDAFDFPVQDLSPPLWSLLAGLGFTTLALASLAIAYAGAWQILNGGKSQDFLDLAKRIKWISLGLFGFWLGYNIITGAVQHFLASGLQDKEGFDFGWDPLDTDILFLILAIVLLAISGVMQRASEAEEENKLFL